MSARSAVDRWLPPPDRRARIGALALPIIGGMISQNVLNLIDTGMVGSLGDAALAAVGLGSFANFMAISFITGLSAGVQAMASRRHGEGRMGETAIPLNGGLLLAVGLGVPWAFLLWHLAPTLFPYLNSDPAVIAQGVPYLQARLVAVALVGMNFAFRGYWNGVNLSRLYMRTLIVMHVGNIALNWLLIFGNLGFPAMGAEGAGVASALATGLGTLTYFGLGWVHARKAGFLRALPQGETLKTMLRLAVPAGLQQLFFSSGYTALFWVIGQVGTAEVAAANVLLNITLVAILPGLGLGLAAASLVGQSLGAKDPDDAARWAWDVVKLGVLGMGALGLPMVLFPELFLGFFLQDPATLALAATPLRLVGATVAFDAVGLILLNAHLGAGASGTVMKASVGLQWGLGLTAAYVVGPVLGGGLLAIWCTQVGYRALQAGVFSFLWKRGSWRRIEV